MKQSVKLLVLILLSIALSGCFDLNVKYRRDGSGEITYIFSKEDAIDIREFKKNLTEINKKAGKEVVRFLDSARTTKNTYLTVSFKKISYLFKDKGLYFGRFNEFAKQNPSRVHSVRNLHGKLIRTERLDPDLFIAFHSAGYIGRVTVQVPGRIIYISEKTKLIKNNKAKIPSSFGFVIFKRANYYWWFLGTSLLILVGLVIFLIFKKKLPLHSDNS